MSDPKNIPRGGWPAGHRVRAMADLEIHDEGGATHVRQGVRGTVLDDSDGHGSTRVHFEGLAPVWCDPSTLVCVACGGHVAAEDAPHGLGRACRCRRPS
jgi:hypothetical protein